MMRVINAKFNGEEKMCLQINCTLLKNYYFVDAMNYM